PRQKSGSFAVRRLWKQIALDEPRRIHGCRCHHNLAAPSSTLAPNPAPGVRSIAADRHSDGAARAPRNAVVLILAGGFILRGRRYTTDTIRGQSRRLRERLARRQRDDVVSIVAALHPH